MVEGRDMSGQVEKFKELARDLEADEDETRFEEAVKKIVQAPKVEPKSED